MSNASNCFILKVELNEILKDNYHNFDFGVELKYCGLNYLLR